MASVQGYAARRVRAESSTAPAELTDRQLLHRFADSRDESAFEALVRRHGSMVLGVCRRLLNDPHSAEDAFQATFLVLVRKAGSIKKPELLGNWLYGVAHRIAGKTRVSALKRSQSERQMVYLPRAEGVPESAHRELRGVLDEEMSRLPEKYRAPLVLCYLEGKTNEEAARELGWPTGSMSWRLARGRELLKQRLLSRDIAGDHLHGIAAPVMALALVSSTVKAGAAFAAGKSAISCGVSAVAARVVEETLYRMVVQKIKAWIASILAFLALLLGGYAAYSAYRYPTYNECPSSVGRHNEAPSAPPGANR